VGGKREKGRKRGGGPLPEPLVDARAEGAATVFLLESTLHCLLSTQRRPSTASPPYHLEPTVRPSSPLSTLGVHRRSDTGHTTASPH
jgi:hypothetical protein